MAKVYLSIIFTFVVGLMFHSTAHSQDAPLFTGHAAADFINVAGYVHFNDFVYDVGLPAAAPAGTVSGWDMQTAFFYHDSAEDKLYVGVDFAGIFGDADGDGDPSSTSNWLNSLNGTDHPDLRETEGFILAFDNGNDGNFDVYIGVSRIDDISGFGIYLYTSDEDESPEIFPVPSTGSVLLYTVKHDGQTPDLEFIIEDISTYINDVCGVNFTIFAGSYEDGPIGEDHMSGSLEICTLPIHLISWSVEGKGRRVALEWTTETEKNNDYFEIQHATDFNSNFKSIGRVEGNGTTNSPTFYTFMHDSPKKGNNYYRIKQVDTNGVEWYSWVITKQYSGSEGRVIEVFPNPNSGKFMLGLPTVAIDTEALIRVIDNKGVVISEQTASFYKGLTTHPINIKGLSEGVYHVLVTFMSSQNTYNKSFIVR